MKSLPQPCYRFPAEWESQSGVQLTWPHANSDWQDYLEEAEDCLSRIAGAISRYERVLIVSANPLETVRRIHPYVQPDRVLLLKCDSNDIWARDHAPLTLVGRGKPLLLDFRFNGWGLKFPAHKDNLISRTCHDSGCLRGVFRSRQHVVLEGGSVETDGAGTLLTTTKCLLSPNRNDDCSRDELTRLLLEELHCKRVLWLEHGHLEGDDTDGHIDTLARFCPNNTIAYAKCTDASDSHYDELQAMEEELKSFRTPDGAPYRLVPLPLPEPVYFEGERLPATYANFLILNSAVLVPTYGQPLSDGRALRLLQQAFAPRRVIGIDCRVLIRQHGSLHCATMQYPEGVLSEKNIANIHLKI
ncbi:MAG: agmatine deiminase family protein [Prevotellaceae bacterium]|jgi:agmatine/peptidylarginine deiminase|nr:agmatine deiminase family protein [Prevotellaceae bacterium]